jgi:glycine oxidase
MSALSAERHVAVVGGGVVGCATAFELARAGLNVTLIERDGVATHASGHNAGNLNPLHGTPPSLIPFALEAFHIHAEVRRELALLGFANYAVLPAKRIHLAYDEADRRQLEEIAAIFASTDGFSSVWLNRDELRQLEPRLAPDTAFGVLTEGCFVLDSHGFTCALAQAAVQLGARIIQEAALGVAASAGRATGIQTSHGIFACDDIVLATGPWVAETKSWLGIDLPVEPVKGEILLMQLPEQAPDYDFSWGLTSLYRRRANEVWLGVTMKHCGFDSTPTAEARDFLLQRAARIMPAIQHAALLDHIAALRPMTPLNQPIAQRADGWQNIYIANGGGSKGMLLSVGIARRVRQLLLDRCEVSGKTLVT